MTRPSALIALAALLAAASALAVTYPVVDTGQTLCYGESFSIGAPAAGQRFYGQDAQHAGNQPSYQDNGDGTVTDLVTGLMWQQDPGAKMTLAEAEAAVTSFSLGGHTDWRLPTIKELYSLIIFTGTDPSGLVGDDTSGLTPFIDPVFAFEYGDPAQGERIIDSQFLTSTLYVSETMAGDATVFGVNFADGRIKGYPVIDPPTQTGKDFFVLFVRGGQDYGVNDFQANGDGTVTDHATGLQWQQADSGAAMSWEAALAYADTLSLGGSTDWRLPDVKELQTLVDYTRSPATHGTPAIDPVFGTSVITVEDGSSDFPFHWSSTSHANYLGDSSGAYVAFGTGYGWMETPPGSGQYSFWDVHGAGCQRSDPKTGDPADYPYGHGPQGDVIRIFNHVRCVRDATTDVGVEDDGDETPAAPGRALRASPNPFNPSTRLDFTLSEPGRVTVTIYDAQGRRTATLLDQTLAAGDHAVTWTGRDATGRTVPAGLYLARVRDAAADRVLKLTLAK